MDPYRKSVEISFNQACKLLKGNFADLGETIDQMSSVLTFLLSPLLPSAGLSDLLSKLSDITGVRAEAMRLASIVLERLRNNNAQSLGRQDRILISYIITCYAAFFESFEGEFTEINNRIKLLPQEKIRISHMAATKAISKPAPGLSSESPSLPDRVMRLPHPTSGLEFEKAELMPLYSELTKQLLLFIDNLEITDDNQDRIKSSLRTIKEKLPEKAFKRFQDLYLELAIQFEEFFIWSTFLRQLALQNQFHNLSENVQLHLKLAKETQNRIDVGLHELGEVVRHISELVNSASEAHYAVRELEVFYNSRIERPLIEDTYESESDEVFRLVFPKRSDAFIPQAFTVLRYDGKQKLEDETTWSNQTVRHDLGAFLLRFLTSPYSETSPLIILGHPGSGKSLLTSIIAARMICPIFTPIRVELRDIDADTEITDQIEQQIRKDTQRDISWASLSEHFLDRPPLVILDGYDELLQASGKVFAAYAKRAQKFQEHQIDLKRKPTRVIITSRLTLIGKAQIPTGATVLRLLDFDESRQQQWISIWNRANSEYFSRNNVKAFEIPKGNKKIEALAQQPLLLLMLALYDSEANQLGHDQSLDQPRLYDNLLRRFVRREREKDEKFKDLPTKEQEADIDRDIDRLGVAAIGMFNRRSLYTSGTNLNRDLEFFGLERKVPDTTTGAKLTQAELLLGSFFFVHESKSAFRSNERQAEGDKTFEFLHNTFGEFLAADFMLKKLIHESIIIYKYSLDEDLFQKKEEILNDPNGFKKDWLARLMYAPLFSRPVILQMMREWLPHCLTQRKLDRQHFEFGLELIVHSQVRQILTGSFLPQLMSHSDTAPFPKYPVLGFSAIYTLNLVILRTILANTAFVFNEDKVESYEDGTRPWDRLTFLWRSWFGLESLSGLNAVIETKRDKTHVVLKGKQSFISNSRNSRLETMYFTSRVLGDNISAGIIGLLIYDAYREQSELSIIEDFLSSEGIDILLETQIKRLRRLQFEITKTEERHYISRSIVHTVNDLLFSSDLLSNIERAQVALSEIANSLYEVRDEEYVKEFLDYLIREIPRRFDRYQLRDMPSSLFSRLIDILFPDPEQLKRMAAVNNRPHYWEEWLRMPHFLVAFIKKFETQISNKEVRLWLNFISSTQLSGDSVFDILLNQMGESKSGDFATIETMAALLDSNINIMRSRGQSDLSYATRHLASYLQNEMSIGTSRITEETARVSIKLINVALKLGERQYAQEVYRTTLQRQQNVSVYNNILRELDSGSIGNLRYIADELEDNLLKNTLDEILNTKSRRSNRNKKPKAN